MIGCPTKLFIGNQWFDTQSGKTLGDMGGVAATFRHNADAADKMEGATAPLGPDYIDFTVTEPLGVTAHITPWNFPLGMTNRGAIQATGVTTRNVGH